MNTRSITRKIGEPRYRCPEDAQNGSLHRKVVAFEGLSHSDSIASFTARSSPGILPTSLDTDDYHVPFNFLSAPSFDTLS